MTNAVSIQMIHEDLEALKRDFAELKALLLEPTLRKEIVEKVKEARKRMQTRSVSQEQIEQDFGV